MWDKEPQLELNMEQLTGSKLEKEYNKSVHCHLTYLGYMLRTSLQNAGLDGSQAEIKISRRNINNLRYADDTTLMAESEEELKSLLIMVKEQSEKSGLNINIKKSKIMASSPTTSMQIEWGNVETVTDFIFLGFKITANIDWSHKMKRCLLLGRKAMKNLDSIIKSRNITLLTKVW